MTRWTIELTVRPPGVVARWVYRRHGRTVPTAATPPTLEAIVGAALPHSWRWAHHWLATRRGRYFWLPCPTCGREFGGHECGEVLHWTEQGSGRMSCVDCTRKARR
jgi:hypothetical protein